MAIFAAGFRAVDGRCAAVTFLALACGGCGILLIGVGTLRAPRVGSSDSSVTDRLLFRTFSAARSLRARREAVSLGCWPEVIRQLSALTAAGIPQNRVWSELEQAWTSNRGAYLASSGDRVTRDVVSTIGQAARVSEAGMDAVRALESTRPQLFSSKAVVDALTATWSVSKQTGSPISEVLVRIAEAVEDDLDAHAAREAAMSGPRATARLLSALPLVGLAIGLILDADPIGVLVGSLWGRVALGLGMVLGATGALWTRHLVASARGTQTTETMDVSPSWGRPVLRLLGWQGRLERWQS